MHKRLLTKLTQKGEAKLVVQDIKSYEKTRETLALLKILAIGNRQVEEGKTVSANEAISHILQKHEKE